MLQEILHRYRAIGRWEDGRTVYDMARRIFPMVLAVGVEIVDRARSILDAHELIMARDAVHAAVADIHRFDAICSFDRDFDLIRGMRRVEPADATRRSSRRRRS